MKYMITGGNTGLGEEIKKYFSADSYSRSTGHDIIANREDIAKISLGYDVFINNAYDGVFGDSRHQFGQAQLLNEVALHWRDQQKHGHIINIGGVGSDDFSSPFPGWESYNANKSALKHLSLQWTQSFRTGQVRFRTSLITVDRLDTPVGRARDSWTGNGIAMCDVIEQINLCLNVGSNSCISEIVTYVDLNHKQ